MTKYTPEYEYKQVNTREIFVDPLYQRDLNKTRVNKIVKEFNPYLVNACKLSFRDGKLWVFDGQHTIAAIKAKHNGRDTLVDCKVFYGLTRLDEMELFIAQNGASAAVGANDRFRALFNNGDPEIVGMVRACESIGIDVNFSKCRGTNKIVAVKTLYQAYASMNLMQFQDMLSILKEAWDGAPESYSKELLSGLTKFYKTYHGEFKRDRLIKCLRRTTPIFITREGQVSNTGGNTRYAKVVLGLYNSRTTSGRLDDKF